MAKETNVIPPTTLRRLMKDRCNASIVSRNAVLALQEYLTEQAVEITKKALTLAHHAKRKTIGKGDIKLAL